MKIYSPIHEAMPLDIYTIRLVVPSDFSAAKVSMATTNMMNIYFTLLFFHDLLANLSENIRISLTMSQQNIMMNAKRKRQLKRGPQRKSLHPTMSDAQKIAFAGVGMPMNPVCWRSSILNFAKRQAENAAMRNAVNGMTVNQNELYMNAG